MSIRIGIDDPSTTPFEVSTQGNCAVLCGSVWFQRGSQLSHFSRTEDIDSESGTWGAPLHVASRSGNAHVIDLLLQQNADVNAKSTNSIN